MEGSCVRPGDALLPLRLDVGIGGDVALFRMTPLPAGERAGDTRAPTALFGAGSVA